MFSVQIREFREALAPIMGTTADAIWNRQQRVHGVMRDEIPADRPFGRGYPIEATATNAAIVLLTVLDAPRLDETAERIQRLWKARYTRKGGRVRPTYRALTPE